MSETKEQKPIQFYMTKEEIDAIDSILQRFDMSRSQFIRGAIRSEIVKISQLPGPAGSTRPMLIDVVDIVTADPVRPTRTDGVK